MRIKSVLRFLALFGTYCTRYHIGLESQCNTEYLPKTPRPNDLNRLNSTYF